MAADGPPTGVGRAAGRAAGEGERSAELDEEELERWGRRLGRAATAPGSGPGVFVALEGPLGAGKTSLVRAACRGAGVKGKVRSPTFTLHNHHRPPGRRPVHHVDLYRIEGPGELDDLGWDALLAAEGPVFVEWAGRAGDRLPPDRWEIRLELTAGGDRRRVTAREVGDVPEMPPLPGAARPGGGEEAAC